ncbi:methyl-accepting chemotaxis protein [Agrobacterium sp. NPDC089420]|uniref:methyl-accepting chemotaxis protein n=1 Tax=Agrobacterium sp. NPDC089420 TaxID=3363918 RepID=UPI0038505A08
MSFFKNTKIRAKILALIIPISLLGLGGIGMVSKAYKETDTTYSIFIDQNNAATLEVARAATSYMASMAQAFKILAFDPGSPQAHEIEQVYRENLDTTFSRLASAKQLAPEYGAEADVFAARLKDIVSKADQIIVHQNAGRTDIARAILSEIDPQINAWRVDLRNWTEQNVAAVNKTADAITAATDSTIIKVSVIIGIVFLLGITGSVFVSSRGITAPIARLREQMTSLANGDTDAEIDVMGRRDEIGEMAAAVQIFRENAIERIRLERQTEANRSMNEKERVIREEHRVREAADVKFAVDNLAIALSKLSDGDVSYRINDTFVESLDTVRKDFNQSASKLQEALVRVSQNAHGINAGASEIRSAADDLAKRTEQQAAAVEETAAALEEITITVKDSTKRAQEAGQLVNRAKAGAEQSGEVVRKAVTAMGLIATSASEISNIIGVIDEIAFQTNLLALNAGVEAARAGDAGKGFAVVAQEVRELAQRSANAAKEIKGLITTSNVQVQTGVQLVGDTGEALKTIVSEVQEINRHVVAIVEAAQEQSSGLQQINSAVNQMDQDTQRNAAMVEESTAASHSLAREAASLNGLLAQFKLVDNSSLMAAPAPTVRHMAGHEKRETSPARALGRKLASAFSGNAALDANKSEWEEF